MRTTRRYDDARRLVLGILALRLIGSVVLLAAFGYEMYEDERTAAWVELVLTAAVAGGVFAGIISARELLSPRVIAASMLHGPAAWLEAIGDMTPEAGLRGLARFQLAQIEAEADDFGWITDRIVEIADAHADGRIVAMLEGGYDLTGLMESVAAHVAALGKGL